jgi:hypothetical protein
MIVFVESNFCLELAFKRSEFDAANEILAMAESSKITLVVPAFSLVEPHYVLEHDRRLRKRLHDEVTREVGQIERSAGYEQLRSQSRSLLVALASKSDSDATEFEMVKGRIGKCATVLPLTMEIIATASARQLVDLEPHDALVFASVENYLQSNRPKESIFANRDAKGFMAQSITNDLSKLQCAVIPSFDDALGFLKKRLNS